MTSYAYDASSQPFENCPVSELDPYSDEVLTEPWGAYAELQRLGSAVWLSKDRMFALTRHDSVLRALKDVSAFSSGSGVMMNDDMNQVLRGNTLCSDGADHQRSRRVIGRPLNPTALKSLRMRSRPRRSSWSRDWWPKERSVPSQNWPRFCQSTSSPLR
jgi:cytochrome P450